MIENFDAVKMIRKIRDDFYNEIKDMSHEDRMKHIRERTLKAVEAHKEWEKNYDAEKNKEAQESQ